MKGKITMGLLCLVMVAVFCVGTGAINTRADSDGNDTFQRATEITSKKSLTGVLSEKDDKDWYAYTVEEDGPFSFKLTNLDGDTAQWNLAIYDSDASQITYYYNSSSDNSISSRLFSFKKGYTVYVCITKWYDNAINKEYSLQVIKGTEEKYGYELSGLWESEDNDNKKTANKLNKTNPIYGMISLGTDKDVYKYEVAGDGNFSFKLENQTEWTAQWCLTVYDSDYNKIKYFYNSGSEFTIKSESMNRNIGDTIYVEISKWYDNCIGNAYLLSVEDNSKASSKDNSKDDSSTSSKKLATPYSILAGTNVIVGKAEAGATVYVKQGKKTYSAVADSDGIYRVVTAKLGKGKSVKMWQEVGKTTSKKITVKIVEKY